MITTEKLFSERLLDWFDQHGRKDLPWQQNISSYSVWVSEIMLQQTQVSTVIGYYLRFITKFPDINTLAHAKVDDVLALWTGLGYYARARNLHKTAQIIQYEYDGQMPATIDELISLPGIGRSTAGAIMSLAHHKSCAILDGNVKRVLTRYDAVEGWPGHKKVEQQLWKRAEDLLPNKRIANYIQAQMDLGATICTRRKPLCQQCPLISDCQAFKLQRQHDFPTPKAKKALPNKQTVWIVAQDKSGNILLEQRPNLGIWGGLWSFPETDNVKSIQHYCDNNLQISAENIIDKPTIEHIFSHFKLTIRPYLVTFSNNLPQIADNNHLGWYTIRDALRLGLPAPVKAFLKLLESEEFMAHIVHCVKLNKEAEGLDFPPYPGDLGKKLYESVSKEAWQMWLGQQTMLINEYRLSLADSKSQQFLKEELDKYFFGEGSAPPTEFVAE